MELLNRDLQRRLLQELSEIYPSSADMRTSFNDLPARQVGYNFHYLREHGLVSLNSLQTMDGEFHIAQATITARGIDFITDDGGLSAILGVVTVKLHEDSLKALLIEQVEKSVADPTVKSKLIAQIKALPGEGLKLVSTEAMKNGLQHLPDIALWLSRLL